MSMKTPHWRVSTHKDEEDKQLEDEKLEEDFIDKKLEYEMIGVS